MRKPIVSECVTLDGVMQAPGTSATPSPTGVVGLHYVRERSH